MTARLSHLLPYLLIVVLAGTVWAASRPITDAPADPASPDATPAAAADPSASSPADPALQPPQTPEPPPVRRVAVVIVPGTWGAADFWPEVVPNKASFASEVIRAINEDPLQDATVTAFTGRLPNRHEDRLYQANRLAKLLDELGNTHDAVHLLGHSHGGNVAALAAGLTTTPIDTLALLSTPHVTYAVKTADGQTHTLPVYLTREARNNTNTVLCVVPSSDEVPTRYAAILNGLREGDAHDLTAGWREDLGPHRPARGIDPVGDILGALSDSGHDSNLTTSPRLPAADHHIRFKSYAAGQFTIDAHNAVHSRRVGYLLGGLFRDGPSPEALTYFRRLVQPADTDFGWPTPQASWDRWLRVNAEHLELIGWRIDELAVDVDETEANADRTGNAAPDLKLEITSRDGERVLLNLPTQWDTLNPRWETDFFLSKDHEVLVGLYDIDTLGRERIGDKRRVLNRDTNGLESHLPPNPDQNIPWSLRLRFTPLHY